MARTRKLPAKNSKVSAPKQKKGRIAKILAPIGRFIKSVLRPFRFILAPFKTKPLRLIGRILAKIFLLNYFRQSWQELKQVTWPGRRETIQLTFAVFVFAISFGLLIAAVDFGLDKLFREVLL